MGIDKNTLWNISSNSGDQQFTCKCSEVIEYKGALHAQIRLFYSTELLNASRLMRAKGYDFTSDHRVSSGNVVVTFESLHILLQSLETADLEMPESFSLDLTESIWIGISYRDGYVKEPGKPYCTVLIDECNYVCEMVFLIDEGIVRFWGDQLRYWLKQTETG